MVNEWRPIRVQIDDILGPYEAFTRGDLWNGWQCPAFPMESVRRLAADTQAMADSPDYDRADLDIVKVEENDELPQVVIESFGLGGGLLERDVVEPVEGPNRLLLWPVGAWGWVWSEEEVQTQGNGRYR